MEPRGHNGAGARNMHGEPVRDPRITPDMTLSDLIEAYGELYGFMAGHLYRAVEILREGIPKSSLRVLTFTGNLVSTGLRGVLADMIKEGLFNIVITTTGALDHDIARAMGGKYLKGYFEADDIELHERGVHRLGNIFIPVGDYGPKVEAFARRLLEKAVEQGEEWAISDLLKLAGSMIDDDRSILRAAYESGAEMFVPGWPDGAFGTALFTESQRLGRRFIVDYFRDMKKLAGYFFSQEGRPPHS
jgi:deoxyhypusine synthase